MNILLWILQILLAMHTLMGAIWKLANSEQAVPSLAAIPHGGWLALSGVEALCFAGLLLPLFNRRFRMLPAMAAAVIGAEMLLYCGVHLSSGDTNYQPLAYWLATAAFCAFVAIGRWLLRPIKAAA